MSEIIAFIGGGNMASCLIGGLLKAGRASASIRVAEPDAGRAEMLRARFGVAVAATGSEIVAGSQIVVLAVKPQQAREALSGLRIDTGATLVSIAAGVRLDFLRTALGEDVHLVRCMPNTPALYGAGVTGLYAADGAPDAARARAESLLASAGKTCWLNSEAELDAVTALSGSGPAYFFLVVEAMRDAGRALGLAPETADALALQTCVGAARMLESSGVDAQTLRAQVTSKGGTTEAALKTLESAGLRRIFHDALAAASRRSRELGDELALKS